MRVLFLTTGFPSDACPFEGIFHKTAVEALARCGVDVEVVAPVPWVPPLAQYVSAKWRTYVETPRRYDVGAIRVHRPRYVQLPRGDYLGWAHRSYHDSAVSAVSHEPDAVHAHFAYPCGMAARLLRDTWNVPTVLTLHGGDVNTYAVRSRLTRRLFRSAVESADVLLAVSNALAERTYEIAARRPEVLPIGVNLRAFDVEHDRDRARAALGLPGEATVILYVGSLFVEKGIRELLTALEDFPAKSTRCVFVGDGPLSSDVERSPVAHAVGVQPNERIPTYLAAADVLVLPSYTEGMPTVLVEAGAAGVPVVATRVGGIPELLASDRGLLVEPREPAALARAIREVLADRPGAQLRAARLRDHVRTHYDADRTAASLKSLYASLLEKRSREHLSPEGRPLRADTERRQ